MSPLVTFLLPLVLLALAYLMGAREWRAYRSAGEAGSDLFAYSRARLARRLGGLAVLVALALTLATLGVRPARSLHGAHVYLGLIVGELAVLVVLAVVDLIETGRRARPGEGEGEPTRRTSGTPRPGARRRPRHPR